MEMVKLLVNGLNSILVTLYWLIFAKVDSKILYSRGIRPFSIKVKLSNCLNLIIVIKDEYRSNEVGYRHSKHVLFQLDMVIPRPFMACSVISHV